MAASKLSFEEEIKELLDVQDDVNLPNSEFLEDIKELLDGLDVQEQVDFPIELDELERGPTDFVSLTGRKIRGRGGKGIFRSYDPIRLANARKAAASRKMTERGDEPPTKTCRLTSGLVNEGRCKQEFFCLDCEGCDSSSCEHLLHPRKMIGKKQDVDLHKTLTEHTRLQPVGNFVKLIPEAREQLSEEEQQAAAQMEPVIGMDDDDEDFEPLKTLKNEEFFCLDCEGCDSSSCQHLLHPRKIIGRDLALHYRQTQHTRFQPVNNFVMTKLGHVVRTEDPGM